MATESPPRQKKSRRASHVRIKRRPPTFTLNMIDNERSGFAVNKINVSAINDQQPTVPTPTPSLHEGLQNCEAANANDDGMHEHLDVTGDTPISDRSYQARKEMLAHEWNKIREGIVHAVIKSVPLQKEEMCVFCCSKKAEIRCVACIGRATFCKECAILLHKNINVTHPLLLWNVSNFACVHAISGIDDI